MRGSPQLLPTAVPSCCLDQGLMTLLFCLQSTVVVFFFFFAGASEDIWSLILYTNCYQTRVCIRNTWLGEKGSYYRVLVFVRRLVHEMILRHPMRNCCERIRQALDFNLTPSLKSFWISEAKHGILTHFVIGVV